MRSNAPLALMEQLVMLLVFALAAALCLQAFLWADSHSRENAARDRACLEAQNAAEVLKHADGGDTADKLNAAAEVLGGSLEQGLLCVDYDADWTPVPSDGVYRLTAQGIPSGTPGLGLAEVQVTTGGNVGEDLTVLFRLEVAWQEEVAPYA